MAYQPKSYRKFLATSVTAAAMVATIAAPGIPTASAADAGFKDSIPEWAEDAVNYLLEKGAIEGYPDGTYRASGAITRAEAAKIIALSIDLDVDENAVADFPDTKTHWGTSYIAALVKEGILDGYPSGNFLPDGKITRQEMAKIVAVAYDLELDVDSNLNTDFPDNNDWGADYITILASLGIVEGRTGSNAGKFVPHDNVSRAETPVFIHRAEVPEVRVGADLAVLSAKALDETTVQVSFNDGETQNFTVDKLEVGKATEVEIEYKGKTFKVTVTWDPANAVAPGTVAFSNQPTGKALPFGSQVNEVYRFQVTAGEDSITLRSVQLKQYGTARANSNDVTNVHLAIDGDIRATGSINANGEVRLTRSVTIPANSTVEFTVLADINVSGEATPTATVQFGVESINAFTANAKLNGSFPNVGESFSIVAGNIGNVKVTGNAKGDKDNEETRYEIETGDIQEEIGKVTLQAGSAEGVKVNRITLEANGLNADDFENLYLYENNGSDRIDVQGVASRNDVVFDLSDSGIEIGRNQAKTFILKGDPLETSTGGKFELAHSYNLVAQGLNSGYNNGNDIRTQNGVSLGQIDVDLGSPTFRVSTNSPKSGDKIVASTSDYGLVREYTLNPAGQEITLTEADIRIFWDNTTPDIKDLDALGNSIRTLELYDAKTGSVITTFDIQGKELKNSDGVAKKLEDLNWYLDGSMDLQVRAVATSDNVKVDKFDVLIDKISYDVQTATGSNKTGSVEGPVSGAQYKEFTTSGDTEVQRPGSSSKIDGYSISGGISNAFLGNFRVEAKEENVRLTDAEIKINGLSSNVKTHQLFSNPTLVYDGEVVAYGDINTNSGVIEFDFEDNFVVEKGSSNRKVLELRADVLENNNARTESGFMPVVTKLETRGVNSNLVTNANISGTNGNMLESNLDYRNTSVSIEVSKDAIDTVATPSSRLLKFTVANLAPNNPSDGSKQAKIEQFGFENLFNFPNPSASGFTLDREIFELRDDKAKLITSNGNKDFKGSIQVEGSDLTRKVVLNTNKGTGSAEETDAEQAELQVTITGFSELELETKSENDIDHEKYNAHDVVLKLVDASDDQGIAVSDETITISLHVEDLTEPYSITGITHDDLTIGGSLSVDDLEAINSAADKTLLIGEMDNGVNHVPAGSDLDYFSLSGDDDKEFFLYADLSQKLNANADYSIFRNVRMQLDAKASLWKITENQGGKEIRPLLINKGEGPDITITD